MGGSATASCGLAPADRFLVSLRSWPSPDGNITDNVARARRVADACHRHGGAVLRSISTTNEVRDIDRFRQALGERKLSAWGVSYGTYVGAVYAQKYPQHTDRWVLDSSGDPDPARVERGWLANMSAAADDRFPDFAAWAADPARDKDGLRLAARPEEVRPLFLALAAKLDRAPRESTTESVPLTGNMLRQALQNALYNDASFAPLARLVQQAQDPAARPDLPPTSPGRCPTPTPPPSWRPSATTCAGRHRSPPTGARSPPTGPATRSPPACRRTSRPAPSGRTRRTPGPPGSPTTDRPTS
ncbi:alpha/beta fold hydrolase [Streptomyces endophytica]|uniref:alpha/beta fold hydrolase n=1 Tax=Streptomyces endophytica TaxID=2991496 RepID=UPI003C6F982B